jgi:hypothetical protein
MKNYYKYILLNGVLLAIIALARLGNALPETTSNAKFEFLSGPYVSNLVPCHAYTALVDCRPIIETNGLSTWCTVSADNLFVWVFVVNCTTTEIATLRLPLRYLCSVNLLDSRGSEVVKTKGGQEWGRGLSISEIEKWLKPRLERRPGGPRSIYRKIFPADSVGCMHTSLGEFSLKEIFGDLLPGNYTLEVRACIVQMGQQKSGYRCFITNWLPSYKAMIKYSHQKVQISNENR